MPDAKRDLSTLQKHAKRMIMLAEASIKRGFKYDESDHYGFMLLSFFTKQSEHLRSVCTLIEAGHYRDATIIARVMLEGLCTLLWSAADPEERPLQWRAYSLVSDWNLLQGKEANGDVVDPTLKKRLIERLKEYGVRYHTKKARAEGPEKLDRPFQRTWLLDGGGNHIRRGDIFDEVRGTELYSLYEDFSQWVHWTPRGIGETIVRTSEGVSYDPNAYALGAQSLAVGIQAILQTADLVFAHFRLESSPTINDLRDSYLKDLNIEI